MRLLAVAHAPVNQTELRLIVEHTGLPGRDLCARPWREAMQQLGLLRPNKSLFECASDIANILVFEALRDGEYDRMERAVSFTLTSHDRFGYTDTIGSLASYRRRIRDAFFRQDVDAMTKALQINNPWQEPAPAMTVTLLNALLPILLDWFALLAAPFRYQIARAVTDSEGPRPATWHMAHRLLSQPGEGAICRYADILRAEQAAVKGDLALAASLVNGAQGARVTETLAIIQFISGDSNGALATFAKALTERRRTSAYASVYLPGFAGFLYCLALIKDGTPVALRKLARQVEVATRARTFEPMLPAFTRLQTLADQVHNEAPAPSPTENFGTPHPFTILADVLGARWLGLTPEPFDLDLLHEHIAEAQASNLTWLADEMRAIAEGEGDSLLLNLIPRMEPWERALAALSRLSTATRSSTAPTRLIWTLGSHYGHHVELEPREQTLGKSGKWSKGRAVALKRLVETPDTIAGLTAIDRKMIRSIEKARYGYGRSNYVLNHETALRAAAGHPLIFREEDMTTPVSIAEREPELSVREQDSVVHIAIFPYAGSLEPIGAQGKSASRQEIIIVEGDHHIDVFGFTGEHQQISRILGPDGLSVPLSARDRVVQSITAIAPLLTVHSDLEGTNAELERVTADPHLYLHLQPQGEGIRVAPGVQPFGEGPRFLPGEGGSTVIAEVNGQRVQAERDLAQEREIAHKVLEACDGLFAEDGGFWRFANLEQALEGLLVLRDMADDVICAWPEGKSLKVGTVAGASSLSLSVREKTDWFEVDGELALDEDRVFDLQKLLAIMQHAPGRFIQLGEDEFVALTDGLRRRLDTLRSVMVDGQVPRLGGYQLDTIVDEITLDADSGFTAFRERLGAARDLNVPLPTTFDGELRDYQRDGFQWLVRLAAWGAGACLADDMGLGKTIQSIAMLLHRAADGPALVIAPTSVCQNWIDEIEKFAPALRATTFGAGLRRAQVEGQGPGDVLVCSYGLIATESDLFAETKWHTIIADEAQAFKNSGTQRSRAIMRLSGDFKVITTGTPVENHLGELWNLFQFINRGLLGSFANFSETIAKPIDAGQEDAGARLRELTSPFILRRMKGEVLSELPPRTDITLTVELNEQETALYEALRREAKSDLESAGDGEVHMIALARITRLRRAVCNPSLVLPEANIKSSKLELFGQLVSELIENGHRVLVFSQFVSHLTLIRQFLDSEDYTYQYLDGRTKPADRIRAVSQFQAGVGDLFLISLKAGGTGLNLTAADYVIHMDPWWNPAVEDQASDRAHRIGQHRPVTVYRLIAADTIEQKIVELHARKRELANDLLQGADRGARLSFEEMLSLIEAD